MPADTRWPVDDEVVEALANALCDAFDLGHGRERQYEGPCNKHQEIARDFLARHRLVRLPEEPTEWEFEEYDAAGVARWSDCALRGTAMALSVDRDSTGRYRPVWSIRIPGQPIHVNEENDDAE